MPLYINTNVLSLNAQTNLSKNTDMLESSMEKLSSGLRINRAGDDAAGLELSEGLISQINGSQQALANTQDGINMLNVLDGAYGTIEDNLQRMRELAVQAANDTYSLSQRGAIQTEMNALYSDWDRIASSTEYNGIHLLDGTAGAFNLEVGPGQQALEWDFQMFQPMPKLKVRLLPLIAF